MFTVFYRDPNGNEGTATWPTTAQIADAYAATLARNGYDVVVEAAA